MNGFFTTSECLTKSPLPLLPRCGECGLYRSCQSPKMAVAGNGRRKILVVGEAPGRTEDSRGKPFVGKSGKYLQGVLAEYGVDLFRDCYVTNAAICRPAKNKLPEKAIDHCRPNIVRAIQELQPEVVILLGAAPVRSVIGWLWKEDVGRIGRWAGWQIPSQKINAWVVPTWHPAAVLREQDGKSGGVMELCFKQHLEAACKLEGRPWRKLPDYHRQIELVFDQDRAEDIFVNLKVGDPSRPVAWDVETNMLKPDAEGAEIICVSVCDGEMSYAFPWHASVVYWMKELLVSQVPKIASNAKFEERWTRKVFGHGVRNWAWDTMLAAHIFDNRPGITSIKFQAFVTLGVDSWDDTVKPFFTSKGSNEPNRIREVALPKLLEYCAMDSLMEWHVAQIQAKKLGVKL